MSLVVLLAYSGIAFAMMDNDKMVTLSMLQKKTKLSVLNGDYKTTDGDCYEKNQLNFTQVGNRVKFIDGDIYISDFMKKLGDVVKQKGEQISILFNDKKEYELSLTDATYMLNWYDVQNEFKHLFAAKGWKVLNIVETRQLPQEIEPNFFPTGNLQTVCGGLYPSLNLTLGDKELVRTDPTLDFFEKINSLFDEKYTTTAATNGIATIARTKCTAITVILEQNGQIGWTHLNVKDIIPWMVQSIPYRWRILKGGTIAMLLGTAAVLIYYFKK